MPRQLALDLAARPALGREAFFVSPANAEALAALEAWEGWPGRRHLLLGPEGSGKTHLAHVWAAMADARVIAAARLGTGEVPALAAGPVAIEDVDRGVDEAALFHLLNLAQAEGAPVLLTATRLPAAPLLALPDLASRIAAMPRSRLAPPDDALLAAVLVKLFDDRQIAVAPQVIDYLLPRIERSFDAARGVVAALDRAALAERRRVTVPLAARVLDKDGGGDA